MSNIVVGIEGLSDTGKTTLAKNICNSINGILLDTGMLYRILAICIISKELDIYTEISKPLEQLLNEHKITYDYIKYCFTCPYNDMDITDVKVTSIATKIGAKTKTDYYYFFAQILDKLKIGNNVVLVGRNVNLIYDLDFHFYLTASTRKRTEILLNKNKEIPYEKAFQIVKQREKIEKKGFSSLNKFHPITIDVSNYCEHELYIYILSLISYLTK